MCSASLHIPTPATKHLKKTLKKMKKKKKTVQYIL